MRKQILSLFLASLMFGVMPYSVHADTFSNSTCQWRLTNTQNVQTANFSEKNGGMLTISTGSAADGSTRLDISPGKGSSMSQIRLEQSGTPGSPVEGDIWNDLPTKSIVSFQDGMKEWLSGPIYTSTGCTITTTTFPMSSLNVSTLTAASSSFDGSITLPANYLVAGKMIRYSILGTLSTPQNTASAISFAVKLGTTTVGTTGGILYPVGLSSMTFSLQGVLECVSVGTFSLGSATTTTQFRVTVDSGTTQLPAGVFTVGNSTNNIAGVNTTVANDLNIVVGFASTSLGTVLITTSIIYEDIN